MPGPIVYLPVELRSREFDAKALLAGLLVGRGYPVVLGQQWILFENLPRLPAGVVLFKSFNRTHQTPMLKARAAGHRVMAMDEEALAHADAALVRMLAADGVFRCVDQIIAQSAFERDVLRAMPGGDRVPIEVSGNGRIDLLKPRFRGFFRDDIAAIRRRVGEYVLVNTNFAVVNSVWGGVAQVMQAEIQAGFLDPADPAQVSRWNGFAARETATRDAMLAAIAELQRRRPGLSIVVRPHPNENLDWWRAALAGRADVHVEREGSHVPWTLGSRALLHASCTTGFEAHVAGVAALSLVPVAGLTTGSLLCNRVNPVFSQPGAMIDALEQVLDGGAPASAPQISPPPEHFVWNYADADGSRRSAELLLAGLPPPAGLDLAALGPLERSEQLKAKFSVSLRECEDVFTRLAQVAGGSPPALREIGDSLFLAAPPALSSAIRIQPPLADHASLRAAMEAAGQAGRFEEVHALFERNRAEAARHSDLCFFAGVALHELGRHAAALQCLQQASLAASGMVDANICHWLGRTHEQLGNLEAAARYAEHAWRLAPSHTPFFDYHKAAARRAGRVVPRHWVVLGCSHVRYFRYMQVNRHKFFEDAVHLECYEFGGATAYGLGNAASDAGALRATRELRPRLAGADRVLVHFGEVDCRRAAWKAAAVSGRSIEETIAESAAHLEAYVRDEVLPWRRSVLIVGAKPQIVGSEDFHRVAQDDERAVFKPIEERERITVLFNALLREAAGRLEVDYADFHHVMATDKSRRQFFKRVYWDDYRSDTHGNADYLAGLYHARLREFAA